MGSYAQNDSRLVADGALHQLSRHLGQHLAFCSHNFCSPLGQNAANKILILWDRKLYSNYSRLVADGALHQLSRHLGQIAAHYRQHFADPLGQNAAQIFLAACNTRTQAEDCPS